MEMALNIVALWFIVFSFFPCFNVCVDVLHALPNLNRKIVMKKWFARDITLNTTALERLIVLRTEMKDTVEVEDSAVDVIPPG